jgi:hypothetical protein
MQNHATSGRRNRAAPIFFLKKPDLRVRDHPGTASPETSSGHRSLARAVRTATDLQE